MDEDEQEIWKVEEIVNSRRVKALEQYKVLWTSYTELEDGYQTLDHLHNYPAKPQEFWQKFFRQP